MMNRFPPPSSLEQILDDTWGHLGRGVADRRHPFRTGTLTTGAPDGWPEGRTVVLRHADRESWTLTFHTDIRSPKWRALSADPRATWVFYHPKAKMQVRARVYVELDTESARRAQLWRGMNASCRRTYWVGMTPGTPVPGPPPAPPLPSIEDIEPDPGRDNFGRGIGRIERLEALYLYADGHRRACFAGFGGLKRTWLSP